MRRPVLGAAVLLGVSLLECLGPYQNVGEKLDVVNLVNGTSSIALDAGAARILILAEFDCAPAPPPPPPRRRSRGGRRRRPSPASTSSSHVRCRPCRARTSGTPRTNLRS